MPCFLPGAPHPCFKSRPRGACLPTCVGDLSESGDFAAAAADAPGPERAVLLGVSHLARTTSSAPSSSSAAPAPPGMEKVSLAAGPRAGLTGPGVGLEVGVALRKHHHTVSMTT